MRAAAISLHMVMQLSALSPLGCHTAAGRYSTHQRAPEPAAGLTLSVHSGNVQAQTQGQLPVPAQCQTQRQLYEQVLALA